MNSNICFPPSLIGSWIEREYWKVYGKETSEKNTIYFSLFGIVVKRKGSMMENKVSLVSSSLNCTNPCMLF